MKRALTVLSVALIAIAASCSNDEPGVPDDTTDNTTTVYPVAGNFSPDTVNDYVRVGFVLTENSFVYVELFATDTVIDVLTSRYLIGRTLTTEGSESYIQDLSTGDATLLRVPDGSDVWIQGANEAGIGVGSFVRRLSDGSDVTIAFRVDLATRTVQESAVPGAVATSFVSIDEAGNALGNVFFGEDSAQNGYFVERPDGERVDLGRPGFERSLTYQGFAADGRLVASRPGDPAGAVLSTLRTDGTLQHEFVDVVLEDGTAVETWVIGVDRDGTLLVSYDLPGDVPSTVIATWPPGAARPVPVADPPLIFRAEGGGFMSYAGIGNGRIWGTATYFGP